MCKNCKLELTDPKRLDYNKGQIYKVVSPNCDKIYYGSTVTGLTVRMSCHNKKHRQDCTSRKIIDAGNARIERIEFFPCSCIWELEDREAYFIKNDFEGCVNEIIPGQLRRAGSMPAYNATPHRRAVIRAYYTRPEVMARKAEKISCDNCGRYLSRGNMPAHTKTKRCMNYKCLTQNPKQEQEAKQIPLDQKLKHEEPKSCAVTIVASS